MQLTKIERQMCDRLGVTEAAFLKTKQAKLAAMGDDSDEHRDAPSPLTQREMKMAE